METATHAKLKRLGLAFLREHGCQAVATEVRCPIARYRVDVAGFRDGRGGEAPATVVIECKGRRSDFLKDCRDRERLLRQRQQLESLQHAIEERRIKVEEPHLRQGETALFPELEEWDYAASRLPAYRKVIRRLRRIDAMVHGETKFCLMAIYGLADALYIAAPRGLVRRGELPPSWGLLECPRSRLRDPSVRGDLFGSAFTVTKRATPRRTPERFRMRLLRNIAAAASRVAYAAETGMARREVPSSGKMRGHPGPITGRA